MPVIKVYHHGMTAAIPPRKNNHERAKRGVVQGWSKSATRNNTRWLRSVSPDSFGSDTEFGVAFTLTIRDCPDSSDDWHAIRTNFIKRLRRQGMLRLHWVTEWQRRGVPHLHGIVFFPVGIESAASDSLACNRLIAKSWIAVAGKYGASPRGQHLKMVTDIKGWFKYLSKHASRGADHYQRSSAGVPSGWIKTGRVWGHCGDWITDEPQSLNVSNEFYFALRRIVRKWRLSDARKALKDSPIMTIKGDWFVINPNWLSAKKKDQFCKKDSEKQRFQKIPGQGSF